MLRISKEEFCNFINTWLQFWESIGKLEEQGFNIIESPVCQSIHSFYDVISSLFDFEDDEITNIYGTDLDYFVYELDCGRFWTPDSIQDKDGAPIDLSTPEKFYDFIIKFRKKKNDN